MQHWQDYVLGAGSLIFTVALIPSLRSRNKPAISTSLVTFAVLVVFAITYVTLSLWFSAFSIAINAAAWLTLAVQQSKMKASSDTDISQALEKPAGSSSHPDQLR